MFTVCPKCALTLVVTAADLRIAQGYVRCGRCLNVFNALARLSEHRPGEPAPEVAATESTDSEAPQQEAAPQATALSTPSAPVTPPESATPPAPSASSAPSTSSALSAPSTSATPSGQSAQSTSFTPSPLSAPSAPSAPSALSAPSAPSVPLSTASTADDTGEIEIELDSSVIVTSSRPPTAPQGAAGLEALVMREPVSASPPPASKATAATPQAGTQSIAATPAEAAQRSPAPSTEQQRTEDSSQADANAEAQDAQQTNTAQQDPDAAFELEARRPRAGLAWTLGAGALAIVLALQIVNHYRDALAASPTLGGSLTRLYSALGVKLAPRWNIHAYDVRQLGASVAGAASGEIIVRASVKNTASSAQPLPLLRVTLQDRFGNRIAARDVPPPDYLPSSVASRALLAAGSRVDATMVFVDPGPQAVGFEIDACLRWQTGEVACAHGP